MPGKTYQPANGLFPIHKAAILQPMRFHVVRFYSLSGGGGGGGGVGGGQLGNLMF